MEKGEKTKLLGDVSLSGKILETLMHVRAVWNDLKFNSGRCGKAGQLVPVSDGSPHLLVAEADGRAERERDIYSTFNFVSKFETSQKLYKQITN